MAVDRLNQCENIVTLAEDSIRKKEIEALRAR
jgi:hypothetical protein